MYMYMLYIYIDTLVTVEYHTFILELQLEELLVSSPLHQFRKNMPPLRAKLSRLKAVLVPDPLQILMGGSLSEDRIFGYRGAVQ